MKAIIMAGGEGTRLRPLTCTQPKPLAPVGGVPALTHILRLLRRHGVSEAAVTTKYLADKITEKYGAESCGVRLRWFREETPLGTAGGVRSVGLEPNGENTDGFIGNEPFIVISGDAVCELNLTAAYNAHIKNKADVTIILSEVENPLEYGVVVCGSDGEILRFIEKPAWSQAFSSSVNTGIYIINPEVLSLIPQGCVYDFGGELFPDMLRRGYKLYGFSDSGYWCDIGDISAFYGCNMRLSGRESVFGAGCTVPTEAKVSRSVIFDNVKIGNGCNIDGAVICENVRLGDNVTVRSGCVIGADTTVGDGAVIESGVRIWNGKSIKEGAYIVNNVIFGDGGSEIFDEAGLGLDFKTADAGYCVRLGAAVAAAALKTAAKTAGHEVRVGVMDDGSQGSRFVSDALVCGLTSGGACAVRLGCGFGSAAAFAAVRLSFDVCLCVRSGDGKLNIGIYDKNGLYPERSFERALSSALQKPDAERPDIQKLHAPRTAEGILMLYETELGNILKPVGGGRLRAGFETNKTSALLARVAEGYTAPPQESGDDGLYFSADETGHELFINEFQSGAVTTADMWHISAVILAYELRHGLKNVALPYTAPLALRRMAEEAGAELRLFASCPHDKSERLARESAALQPWLTDALFAAVYIIKIIIEENKPLRELLSEIPPFCSETRDLDAGDKYKAAVQKKLGEPAGEGVCIDFGSAGTVRIVPKKQSGFRLIAEAVSTEAANEILDLSSKKIRELI